MRFINLFSNRHPGWYLFVIYLTFSLYIFKNDAYSVLGFRQTPYLELIEVIFLHRWWYWFVFCLVFSLYLI